MFLIRFSIVISLFFSFATEVRSNTRIIIAENGGGNLGEHTLPAVTLAAARGVEYLQLHVVMTADDHLLVFRELTLDSLTDVAEVFPDHRRDDGSFYAIDFTLDEIRQLRLTHPLDQSGIPPFLTIPTLEEELALIRRLETLLERPLGIVLEIRRPWFHGDLDKDISSATLDTLLNFGYTDAADKLFVQCFDPDELQRIHGQLMPERKMRLPLIQLVGDNEGKETRQKILGQWEPYNYDWLFTNIGLRMLASYAAAIGLPTSSIADDKGNQLRPEYIHDVHAYGMILLAFPINNKPEELPAFAPDFPALLDFYLYRVKVDGLYTNAVHEVVRYQEERAEEERRKADLPLFFSAQGLARPAPVDAVQTTE